MHDRGVCFIRGRFDEGLGSLKRQSHLCSLVLEYYSIYRIVPYASASFCTVLVMLILTFRNFLEELSMPFGNNKIILIDAV